MGRHRQSFAPTGSATWVGSGNGNPSLLAGLGQPSSTVDNRPATRAPSVRMPAQRPGPAHVTAGGRRARGRRGYSTRMFFFFSNRLGCLGSVLVSLIVTAILVLLLWR